MPPNVTKDLSMRTCTGRWARMEKRSLPSRSSSLTTRALRCRKTANTPAAGGHTRIGPQSHTSDTLVADKLQHMSLANCRHSLPVRLGRTFHAGMSGVAA